MISITITPESLSVQGHAGYNAGNDIVCAAVSALVQTFEVSAKEFTTDCIKSSLQDGCAVIAWPRAPTRELKLLIDSFTLGLMQVSAAYPDNVSITCTR